MLCVLPLMLSVAGDGGSSGPAQAVPALGARAEVASLFRIAPFGLRPGGPFQLLGRSSLSRARRRAARPRVDGSARLVVGLVLSIVATVSAQESRSSREDAAQLVAAALEQTTQTVAYDGSYRRIPYPGGDVPAGIGVCTDVVVRAYRRIGIDLQVEVHEDMVRAFRAYPRLWGLTRPDSNVDHRRVPNLQTYLRRAGAALPVSRKAEDYRAEDLVTWMLPGNLPHIGLVTDRRSPTSRSPLVVHNIGRGPELEDVLFAYPISGHYRYRVE